jgi:hypothetical protein
MMPSSMADAVLFHSRRVSESRRSEGLLPVSASRESGSFRMSLDAGPQFYDLLPRSAKRHKRVRKLINRRDQ